MRIITPEHINKMYDEISAYMVFIPGEGYRLKEDAPPEIVAMLEEINKWKADNHIA